MARKKRQQEIPGTEPVSIPQLDAAALEYAAARDARIAAGVKEKKRLDELDDLLKSHNLDLYKFDTEDGDPMIVERKPAKMKIKVRKLKDAEGGSDGEVDDDDKGTE